MLVHSGGSLEQTVKWPSILLFLVLGGCSVDRAGLAGRDRPDGALELDGGDLDGGGLDGGDLDGGRLDAGERDGGDPDGGVDGGLDAGTDAGPTCEAGATRCMDGDVFVCAGGTFVLDDECSALGCGEVGGAHCLVFVPSNVPTEPFLAPSSTTIDAPAVTYDTTTCSEGAVVTQAGGGEVCLMRWAGNLRVTGTIRLQGSRPLIGLVTGDLVIEASGGFDLGGVGQSPGAGGGAGAPSDGSAGGPNPGGNGPERGTFRDGGGGGGGSCGAGGSGGVGGDTDRAAAGAAFPDGFLLEPLRGGGGGGRGARSTRGGGGGGALQLSVLGRITVRGRIDVAGAGGAGGDDDGNYEAGGGGGAGGGVLLESPLGLTFEASASLWAGGGGGGGGGGSSDGGTGDDGDLSPPDGGSSGGSRYGAPGGAGGTDGAGSAGGDNTQGDANGGGGGGGAGCVVVRAPGAVGATPRAPTGHGMYRWAEPRLE